jgi:hypothetical protein
MGEQGGKHSIAGDRIFLFFCGKRSVAAELGEEELARYHVGGEKPMPFGGSGYMFI